MKIQIMKKSKTSPIPQEKQTESQPCPSSSRIENLKNGNFVQIKNNSAHNNKKNHDNDSIGLINAVSPPNPQHTYFDKGSSSYRFINMCKNNGEYSHNYENSKDGPLARLESIQMSNLSKISRLDSELDDIEKMKSIFQSKKGKQMSRSKQGNNSCNLSFQRSGAARSSEKHRVKPSNTPSFTKLTHPVRQFTESDKNSSSKKEKKKDKGLVANPDLHPLMRKTSSKGNAHPRLNKSQQDPHYELASVLNKNSFHCNGQSSNSDEAFDQQSPQSQKLSQKFEKPQMISYNTEIFDQDQHDFENPYGFDQTGTPEMDLQGELDSKQLQYQQEISKQYQLESNHSSNNSKAKGDKCGCISVLTSFMESSSRKMEVLTQKILQLEKFNNQLVKRSRASSESNQQYESKIKLLEEEKEKIEETSLKWKQEKDQMESLLKEVLFKREKEKLKENVSSGQSNKQQANTYQGKSANNRKISTNNDLHKADSKMKVQTLLQKLHIKVQK